MASPVSQETASKRDPFTGYRGNTIGGNSGAVEKFKQMFGYWKERNPGAAMYSPQKVVTNDKRKASWD